MKVVTITVYNTFFTVSVGNPIVYEIMNHFTHRLTHYDYRFDRRFKRMVKGDPTHYYKFDERSKTYRFTIGLLKNFMLTLGSMGINRADVDIIYATNQTVQPLDLNWNKDFKPRDYQKHYIKAITETQGLNVSLVDLATGMGKALHENTPVLTPFGFIAIKDIEVDDIVIGKDGEEVRVTGVYPQGKKQLYRVILEDERSCLCCDEHLWNVYVGNSEVSETINTAKLIELRKNKVQCYIDLPKPHNLQHLPDDEEKAQSLAVDLVSVDTLPEVYLETVPLPKEDSLSIYFKNKLISEWATLRGMDKVGGYETYYTQSIYVAKYLLDILRSLGNIVRLKTDLDNRVFKLVVYRVPNPRNVIKVQAVIKAGVDEAVCIKVDSEDGLFVIKDYIVTHNTLIAMNSILKLNMRTAILVLPKYIDKWIEDVFKYTDVKKEDVYVVKGSDSIVKLSRMKPEDIHYKFIILSMATVREYITAYEENKLSPEIVTPDKFMEHLQVGILLNDESHQHFHALLRISLYMNVKKLIGMTATLDSNRESMRKIYNTMFPPHYRISNLAKKEAYVNVEASGYKLTHTKGVRYYTTRGYNHIEYEHHILKHFKFLKSYLEMIKWYVTERYVKKRQPGDKALVYVSSVRLSSVLTNFLQEQFPDLNVKRFMEDDPYDNIMTADLCVTSAQNGGTALDVPNLVWILMTTSMSSLQANLQTLGRLREIKGRYLLYTYIYCLDIPNQVKMHRDRKDAIRDTVKEFFYSDYCKVVEN